MRLLAFVLLFVGTCHGTGDTNHKATLQGLVLGIYDDGTLTAEATAYNAAVAGALSAALATSPGVVPQGTARLYYNIDAVYDSIAVVGLGSSSAGFDAQEGLDLKKENIRSAVAAGVKALRSFGESSALVDSCGDATAAAEGATLGLYTFDEYKTSKTPNLIIAPYASANQAAWDIGVIMGEGQNKVKELQDIPANILTPTEFANRITALFAGIPNTYVFVHDKAWAQSQGMNSFLSVAQGSEQSPIFLEIHYNNSDVVGEAPIIFAGKGITFDSGGISLKSTSGMRHMRADMTGAAVVMITLYTLARLGEKANVIALAPLTENMLDGRGTHPSDVVRAMNGKTIQIDDTDAEGRLVLADALSYASIQFQPACLIDIATLTGSVETALGMAASGIFTTSETLWVSLYDAGVESGDRVWKLPIFKLFGDQMKVSQLADLNNVNTVSSRGGASTAAAFLKEFNGGVQNWAHWDIAGVMTNPDNSMTGRPLRTAVLFASKFIVTYRG